METGAAAFFSSMPGFAFTLRLSPQGRLSLPFASRGIEDLFGLRPVLVRDDAAPLRGLLHPKDWQTCEAAISEAAQTRKPFQLESRVLRPGQPERWVECHFTPGQRDAAGMHWHGVALDITERKATAKALYDSEHMLQQAQRIAHVGSWYVDLVNDRLVWSDEIFRIWEIDKSKFKADFAAFLETVHPQDRERVVQVYNDSITQRSRYEVEHRLLFPDGRIKHVLEQGEPQYDAQGLPVRFIGTSLDITERKRMESQLRMKEYALDHSGDSVFLLDEDGRFIYVNEQAGRSLGYSRAELLTMSAPAIDPDYPFEKVTAVRDRAVAEGVITFTTRHQRRDGSVFPVEIQLSALDYEGRTLTIAMVRNISERNRLQEVLVESERRFRSLAENIPDNIARWDLQGRYLYINPTHERTLGATLREIRGKSLPELHEEVRAAVAQVAATGRPLQAEQRLMVNGNLEVHSISMVPELDAQGGIVSVLGMGRNVTEIHRMQETIATRERELRALADSSPGMMGAVYFRPDGTVRMPYASPNILELCGLTPQEVARDANLLMKQVHPDDARRVRETILASKRAMTSWHQEYRILHPTKGLRWMEGRTNSQPHPDGGVLWYGHIHDITERKQVLKRMELLDRAIDISAEAVFLIDDQLRFNYVNETACKALGYSRDELLGMGPCDINPDMPRKAILDIITESPLGMPAAIETRHRTKGGHAYPVEVTGVQFEEGGARFGLAVARDISERKRMQEALAAREKEFRTLVEHTPDTIVRYDRSYRRTFVNEAAGALAEGGAAGLLGKTPSECPGGIDGQAYTKNLAEVFATGEDGEFELTWHDPHGKEICYHIHLTAECDPSGDVATVLAVGRDITELHAYRRKIHQLAFYDKLTSLPNRALFGDRLQQMLAEAARHTHHAALVLLDLDGFKAVNDTFGHPAGDRLLCEAGLRLNSCVRSSDTVARLGGDEFAILLPSVRLDYDPGIVASKIIDVFGEPFLLEGKEVFVGASLGIALYPADSEDADDLLKHADSAMYLAKRSGRNTFRFYSEDLTISAKQRLTIETDLRSCVRRGELELYYQPKYRLADNQLAGSEALLRWNHPEHGLVPPDQFIPIAEDSGLIVEIGAWVLREACFTAAQWNGPGKPVHKVAVNLSVRQFQACSLMRNLQEALELSQCQPQWIELEITESLLLEDGDKVLAELEMFRQMGLTIAIDDFGTGYSSLSYLARFPLDTLKIDRSFVSRVMEGGQHAKLVRGIIAIAQSLGQTVVAEGVETLAQAELLQGFGCHLVQGYAFGRPVPKAQVGWALLEH